MDAAAYLKSDEEGATAVLQSWPHKPCLYELVDELAV